ncbi:MAG: hypothetical protein AB1451_10260 [Nitrospirota bacterium]
MREHRWETQASLRFDEVVRLCRRLEAARLPMRSVDRLGACYFEEFWVDRLDEITRLDPWPIEEITLIESDETWSGDFFVLAGQHHERYREHVTMEAYLSLSHPWRIPSHVRVVLHEREAMCWIGFRDTHGFIRVRVVPTEIVTPGEGEVDVRRDQWVSERADAFAVAIEALELPLFVDWSEGLPMVGSAEPGCRIAGSWPDAFGPCQFEYVVLDRYQLLVPAARLVERLGPRPAGLRTFLSGWSHEALAAFHQLQPASKLLYRGFVHARLADLSAIADAVAPRGRALTTLCEFRTLELLPQAHEAYAVVGAIGDREGFTLEIRLNRRPLPANQTSAWLEALLGVPVVYTPLGLY